MKDICLSDLPTIGIIGLGDMGFPIACNLVTANYKVSGFDINDKIVKLFENAGGIVGVCIVDVVKNCDIVMTSLPSSEVFCSVAEKQLIPNARKGQVFIELGTTVPNDVIRIGKQLAAKGANLLDTPVSGGKIGAERAQLKMFIGGEKSIYEKVYPILVAIAGQNTMFYCGTSGSGQAMKGINQLQMGMLNATCLEILSFAVHSGLSLELIQQAFPETNYKITTSIAKKIVAGEGNDIGVKFRELPYYIRQAEEQGYELPLTRLVYDICNKGERIVVDDHRDAPSFWNELTKDMLGNC